MANFQTRVDALTGLTSGTHYTTAELTEYLKDGVIEITNRIVALKPEDAEYFTRSTSSDSQGVDVGRSKILAVMREAAADGSSDGSTAWRACRKIPSFLQSRVVDKDSLDYASQYNPAYAIESTGVVNVYPVPSSNNGIKVLYVNEEPRDITNNASLTHAHENIKYFPNDKVYLVVLYAGIKSVYNYMASKTIIGQEIPNDIVLENVTSTLPTWSAPSGFVMPASLVASDVDFSDVGTIDTFLAPVFEEPTLSISETMTLPPVPIAPNNAVVSQATLPAGGDIPAYTKPTIVLPAEPTITDLTITATVPTKPAAPSISYAAASVGDAISNAVDSIIGAQDAISAAQDAIALGPTDATSSDALSSGFKSNYDAPTNLTLDEAIDDNSDVSLGTDDLYDDTSQWWNVLGEYIEDEEDPDLAALQIQKIKTYIEAYSAQVGNNSTAMQATLKKAELDTQTSISNTQSDSQASIANARNDLDAAVAKMNQSTGAAVSKMQQSTTVATTKMVQSTSASIAKMQQSTSVNIQNATKVLEAAIQEYSLRIQKYQAEVTDYREQVSKELQEYQANSQKDIAIYTQKSNSVLAQYQADIQNELNNFNRDAIEYQAILAKDVKDADLTEAKNVREMQTYAQEIQGYQGEVNKEVQRWTGEIYNKNFNEYQQKFQGRLTEYGNDIQKESSKATTSIQKFQANVEKALQKHQSETGYDVSKYQSEVQAETSRLTIELDKETKRFASLVQAYQAEVQNVSSKNQNKVNDYAAKAQLVLAHIEQYKTDYTWLEGRLMKLQQEYDSAFALMGGRANPPQQQEERRRR